MIQRCVFLWLCCVAQFLLLVVDLNGVASGSTGAGSTTLAGMYQLVDTATDRFDASCVGAAECRATYACECMGIPRDVPSNPTDTPMRNCTSASEYHTLVMESKPYGFWPLDVCSDFEADPLADISGNNRDASWAPLLRNCTAFTPNTTLVVPLSDLPSCATNNSNYREAVQLSGPAAYWTLDCVTGTIDASGTRTVEDNSGFNHTGYILNVTVGTLLGNQPPLLPAGGGHSIGFRAPAQDALLNVSDRVKISGKEWNRNLPCNPGESIELWISIHSNATAEDVGVISDREGSTWSFEVFIEKGSRELVWKQHYYSQLDMVMPALPLNRPTHFVATFDRKSGAVLGYFNGTRVKAVQGPLVRADTVTSDIYIGRNDNRGGGRYSLDEVALYNRPLTAEEVLQHFQAGVTPNYALQLNITNASTAVVVLDDEPFQSRVYPTPTATQSLLQSGLGTAVEFSNELTASWVQPLKLNLLSDDTLFFANTGLTVECWLRRRDRPRTTFPQRVPIVVANWNTSSLLTMEVVYRTTPTLEVTFLTTSRTFSFSLSSPGVTTTHLVLSMGFNTRYSVHVDGKQVVDVDATGHSFAPSVGSPIELVIGHGPHITFDEVAVYDRSLSQTEVLRHYYAGNRPNVTCSQKASMLNITSASCADRRVCFGLFVRCLNAEAMRYQGDGHNCSQYTAAYAAAVASAAGSDPLESITFQRCTSAAQSWLPGFTNDSSVCPSLHPPPSGASGNATALQDICSQGFAFPELAISLSGIGWVDIVASRGVSAVTTALEADLQRNAELRPHMATGSVVGITTSNAVSYGNLTFSFFVHPNYTTTPTGSLVQVPEMFNNTVSLYTTASRMPNPFSLRLDRAVWLHNDSSASLPPLCSNCTDCRSFETEAFGQQPCCFRTLDSVNCPTPKTCDFFIPKTATDIGAATSSTAMTSQFILGLCESNSSIQSIHVVGTGTKSNVSNCTVSAEYYVPDLYPSIQVSVDCAVPDDGAGIPDVYTEDCFTETRTYNVEVTYTDGSVRRLTRVYTKIKVEGLFGCDDVCLLCFGNSLSLDTGALTTVLIVAAVIAGLGCVSCAVCVAVCLCRSSKPRQQQQEQSLPQSPGQTIASPPGVIAEGVVYSGLNDPAVGVVVVSEGAPPYVDNPPGVVYGQGEEMMDIANS